MRNKKYTFFWADDSPFCQWHLSNFVVDNINFNCAEQYMMYQKALLFNDGENAKKIMEYSSPIEQKRIGKGVKGFDISVWDRYKEKIVYQGNYAKFTQNKPMYQALMDTKGTVLVEASPSDKIWGVGLLEHDPKILDERTWQGQNLLGKILTKLRDDLESK